MTATVAGDRSEQPAGAHIAALVKILDKAVRALGDAGQKDLACKLSAEGWALLRDDAPRDAERLNGALHYLTAPPIVPKRMRHSGNGISIDDADAGVASTPQAPGEVTTVATKEAEPMKEDRILEVRDLPPAQRHTLIFETYDALPAGEAFILVNDHDPKPLYYQFAAEHEGQFTWKYLEEGPEVWRVRIGRP